MVGQGHHAVGLHHLEARAGGHGHPGPAGDHLAGAGDLRLRGAAQGEVDGGAGPTQGGAPASGSQSATRRQALAPAAAPSTVPTRRASTIPDCRWPWETSMWLMSPQGALAKMTVNGPPRRACKDSSRAAGKSPQISVPPAMAGCRAKLTRTARGLVAGGDGGERSAAVRRGVRQGAERPHPLVQGAGRLHDGGVALAGVGAHRPFGHHEAPVEGDPGGLAEGEAQAAGLQAGEGLLHGAGDLALQHRQVRLVVLPGEATGAQLAGEGTGVVVGAVDEHPLRGDAGGLLDQAPGPGDGGGADADQVTGDEGERLPARLQDEGAGVEVLVDAGGPAVGVGAGQGDAQGRGDHGAGAGGAQRGAHTPPDDSASLDAGGPGDREGRGSGLEQPLDLALLREAVQGPLGEDEAFAVAHLEDAAPAGDQAHVPDALREDPLQLGRQTGGALVVASSGAVFDAQVECFRHR